MMKVMVLGGAGRVGRRIAELLHERQLAEVTIGDRAAVADVDGMASVVVDIRDSTDLDNALRPHDVVVNCVGPFDVWGGTVLDAAIRTGTDYLDICDDPFPTMDLLERDAQAKEQGVRAVVGMGGSPGLSNLLAVVACKQLDSVETVVNFWGDPHQIVSEHDAPAEARRVARAFRAGRAALDHLFSQTAAPVPVWYGATAREATPWKRGYEVSLTSGERARFRLIGHPEPVTLPSHVAARSAFCIGTVGSALDSVVDTVLGLIDDGLTSVEKAPDVLAQLLEDDPALIVSPWDGPGLPAVIGAVACGQSQGSSTSVVVMPGWEMDGSMSVVTARPAVTAIELLAGVPPGVHPPEGAFVAEQFLDKYAEREHPGSPTLRIDQSEGEMLQLHHDDLVLGSTSPGSPESTGGAP